MKWFPWLCVLLLTSVVGAEVVVLNNGTRVEGKIERTDDGWRVTKSDGTVVEIPSDQVRTIDVGTPATDDSAKAKDRLASLRNVAEHLASLDDIISRYQAFITQTKDDNTLADARQDLAAWQQREAQGLVKVGTQWVSADERMQLSRSAQTVALSARDQILQGRNQNAAAMVQQALNDDPENASALYLQGVLSYTQGQFTAALKEFGAVHAKLSDHAPTLNNLAVLAWHERSYLAAMQFYTKAMQAAPQTREILDNVAEALNAVPAENHQEPATVQAGLIFQQQDTILQKTAGQQGLFRWGSTWVDAAKLAELKAGEAKIQDQIDALMVKYNDLEQQITKIDADTEQNTEEMHRLVAANTVTGAPGMNYTLLPPSYYQLQGDNQKMAEQKKSLQTQTDGLMKQINQVKQSLPTPQFSGVQQIIGADGMPISDMMSPNAGAASQTRPSSGPAVPAQP